MKGSHRINALSESQTLALTKKVRELRASGKDVLGLTLGEPDFDTPDHIREAAIAAIREGFTHYPPVAGIPELRKAVADKFRRENGLDFGPENVVVSTGAKQSLVNAIMALINPGDEVIMPAPYWVSYVEMVKMAEASWVELPTTVESGFKITAAQLEAAITPRTRMFIINSPNNPTGAVYSRAEMDAIAEVLSRYPEIYVLSDEIYEHLVYGAEPVSLGTYPALKDRTITVNGLSKAYAMTGWRLGYIGAPKWIADLCEKYQGQITSGANSITQKAAVVALNGPMDTVYAMREQFRKRREFMYAELKKIPDIGLYEPEGAFYFYPDMRAYLGRTTPSGEVITDIDALVMYLISDGLVAVIPGSAFGTDSHIRISYAYALETLKTGMERIQDALARLR